jgi:hypothetical protein
VRQDHQHFEEEVLQAFGLGEEEEGPGLAGALAQVDLVLVELEFELGDVAEEDDKDCVRKELLSAAVQAEMVSMR